MSLRAMNPLKAELASHARLSPIDFGEKTFYTIEKKMKADPESFKIDFNGRNSNLQKIDRIALTIHYQG